jgi:hypothetical protein
MSATKRLRYVILFGKEHLQRLAELAPATGAGLVLDLLDPAKDKASFGFTMGDVRYRLFSNREVSDKERDFAIVMDYEKDADIPQNVVDAARKRLGIPE